MPELTEQFRFSTVIQVRFSDTDALAHVNNAKYLSYLEEARMYYILHLFGRRAEEDRRESFILAEAVVKFKAPAHAADRLEVFTRVSRLGTKSFDMEYLVLNADSRNVVCEGKTVQVMYDYKNGTTIPLPDAIRTKIEEFEGDGVLKSKPAVAGKTEKA